MEYICGKRTYYLSPSELEARLEGYREIVMDIGTGDGRYVLELARARPERLAIGFDACREQLGRVSRQAPPNSLFLIGNALALPAALAGRVCRVTINFPWGSLLAGLLEGDPCFMAGLRMAAAPGFELEIRLNSSAVRHQGHELEESGELVRRALEQGGFATPGLARLPAQALKNFPTTWSKKLGFGRDPSALLIQARLQEAVMAV